MEKLLTTKELAIALSCSRTTIWRKVKVKFQIAREV